jgi:hypothetical protein
LAISAGIQKRFAHTRETKKHADKTLEEGRELVEAYVEFTHYVERLHLGAEGHSARAFQGKEQAEKHHY